MRFLSLDLIRYGHFTGRAIAFDPEAAIHIVYGPNEAGKSSALAAFSDLLFGFPDRNVGYDFLHPARDLRLGAEIAARDGAKLAFRRRKGRSNTLLDVAETALKDDALAPYLGSLDRTVFERAFGLDSARLRAGADEMLADGGEIGQLLFSAASGLTGLRAASEALAGEADGIYAPRKSQNRSFYQALERYEGARKAEREHQLNASDWNALLKEEREIAEAFAEIEERQLARARRIAELERLQRLRGLLREIDAARAALAAFTDIEAVDIAVGAALGELEAEKARLAGQVADKESRRKAGLGELEQLAIDDSLLERRADIGRLQRESGLYDQAAENLPRRRQALDEVETGLRGLAGQLGFINIEELEKHFPDAVLRSEFEALIEEVSSHRRTRDHVGKALAEAKETLARLEAESGEGHLADPAPLRRAFEALREDFPGIRQAETLEAEIAGKERALLDQAAALRPAVGDILSLRREAMPEGGALKEASSRLAAATGTLEKCEADVAALAADCTRLEALLEADRQAGPVPTREAIGAARVRRDSLFGAIGDDPRAYLAAVGDADRLADNALDDAERVARHADHQRQLEERRAMMRQAEEGRAQAAAGVETAQAEYRALFEPLAITPLAPDVMQDWLRRVESLLEGRSDLFALQDRKKILDRQNGALAAALSRLAESLGVDEALPLAALAREVETALSRLGERWVEAREHEGRLKAARQAIERGDGERNRLRADGEVLAARFRQSLVRLGLPEDTGIAGASAALSLWNELPGLLATRDRLAGEVASDSARIEAFETEAHALAEALAADLAGDPAGLIVHKLHQRAGEHAQLAARREMLEESIARLQAELETDLAALREREARIATIAVELPAGVSTEGLVTRLQEREALRQTLAQARRRFSDLSEGAGEEETRDLAEALDPERCAQELERLNADAGEDRSEIELLRERRTGLRHRRQALETGEGAESAAFDRASAEAEAQALARQWVVLRLAGKMLDGALERYRKGRADPVLEAASRYFRMLTRDGFSGLAQAYGEQDSLVLSAVRSDVAVEGLSDGTRDQLYLALRLAFLEDYASRNEPPPLIVDDIFQTFDDDRSAAGLTALGSLSGVQTILFTHEASMIEIARKTLGGRADIIMLER